MLYLTRIENGITIFQDQIICTSEELHDDVLTSIHKKAESDGHLSLLYPDYGFPQDSTLLHIKQEGSVEIIVSTLPSFYKESTFEVELKYPVIATEVAILTVPSASMAEAISIVKRDLSSHGLDKVSSDYNPDNRTKIVSGYGEAIYPDYRVGLGVYVDGNEIETPEEYMVAISDSLKFSHPGSPNSQIKLVALVTKTNTEETDAYPFLGGVYQTPEFLSHLIRTPNMKIVWMHKLNY